MASQPINSCPNLLVSVKASNLKIIVSEKYLLCYPEKMKIVILSLLISNFSLAADWKIKSITITKAVAPKELQEHLGDSRVEIEIKNTSSKTIKVATNLNWYLGTPDFHKYNGICCHPPIYEAIQPNQIIKIRFNDSSKNIHEEKKLYIQGEDGSIFVDKFKLSQPIKNV